MNTNINKQDESLQDAALKKYPNASTKDYDAIKYIAFVDGATWQKEKDKAVIDKLIGLVKRAAFWFSNEANYPEGTNGYKFNKEAIKILQENANTI